MWEGGRTSSGTNFALHAEAFILPRSMMRVTYLEWGMYQLGAVVRSSIGLCPELIWVQLQGAMGR